MPNITHITSHVGGGVGTVIRGWLENDKSNTHTVICLDTINQKTKQHAEDNGYPVRRALNRTIRKSFIEWADIVVVHYWDHPLLYEFLSEPLPDARVVFWCHKNFEIPQEHLGYPDMFVATSPVIDIDYSNHKNTVIWSTGGIDRFLNIKKKKHKRFTIGYVGTVDYKKLHPDFIKMCNAIDIPNVRIIVIGENKIGEESTNRIEFIGQVDDITPYLAQMDVFFYPLRSDHYGTCEQVLGEAMAAGVVPVVMNNECEKHILVNDGGFNGYKTRNWNEVSMVIEYLHDFASDREFQSQNARKTAKKLYPIDKMINYWNELFNKLMKQPKTRRATIET